MRFWRSKKGNGSNTGMDGVRHRPRRCDKGKATVMGRAQGWELHHCGPKSKTMLCHLVPPQVPLEALAVGEGRHRCGLSWVSATWRVMPLPIGI